jgi:hypothetical protein
MGLLYLTILWSEIVWYSQGPFAPHVQVPLAVALTIMLHEMSVADCVTASTGVVVGMTVLSVAAQQIKASIRRCQQYTLIVPLLYSMYCLLHVLAVACHHQGTYFFVSVFKLMLPYFAIYTCSPSCAVYKVKGKGHPITGHEGPRGGVEV